MVFLHLPHFQIPVACLFTLIKQSGDDISVREATTWLCQLVVSNLRVLAAEGAAVGGVLGHFHLLDDLTEGSTISGSVLTANSDLLSVVSLVKVKSNRSCQRHPFPRKSKREPSQTATHIPSTIALTILISLTTTKINLSDGQLCRLERLDLRFFVDTTKLAAVALYQ